MKKTSRLAVILCALYAVLWSARAKLEVIYQTYNDSIFRFVLNILCALMGIAAFIVNLKRYRSGKEE